MSFEGYRDGMKTEVLITVRCKKGHEKQFGKEGPPAGVAFCDVCHRVMVPVRVDGRSRRG